MTKADFFNQLEERLRGLPEQERQNIIRVYEDLFETAAAGGKNEEEIIRSLEHGSPVPPQTSGVPRTEQLPNRQAPDRQPQGQVHVPEGKPAFTSAVKFGPRSLFAFFALAFFNLIFVLGPLVAVGSVIFSIAVVSLVLAFSPLWIIIGSGIPGSVTALQLEVFAALALTGLGVLMGIGMYYMARLFIKLVKTYALLNLRLIRGE